MIIKSKNVSITKYWDVIDYYNLPKLSISYEEAELELENILRSAFNYRMVADVPVGIFLSGGYDSTLVASILQKHSSNKLKTFTIGFADPRFNESQHAAEVAKHLQTEHYAYTCSYSDALAIIEQLPFIYDEPFGDISSIPTVLVSQLARREVKVALSADAGDELFAGYSKYSHTLRLMRNPGFYRQQPAPQFQKLLATVNLP